MQIGLGRNNAAAAAQPRPSVVILSKDEWEYLRTQVQQCRLIREFASDAPTGDLLALEGSLPTEQGVHLVMVPWLFPGLAFCPDIWPAGGSGPAPSPGTRNSSLFPFPRIASKQEKTTTGIPRVCPPTRAVTSCCRGGDTAHVTSPVVVSVARQLQVLGWHLLFLSPGWNPGH